MIKKLFAILLALISIGTAVFALNLCETYVDEPPILLTPPHLAKSQVVTLMNAICDGEYEKASQTILGTPNLGIDREASDATGTLIWNAYLDSLSYELVGECYTTEAGLAQKVTITCLDITSVTQNLKERSIPLLEQRVEAAKNTSDIYDENNEYREDFVMSVLYDAVTDALHEDAQMQTVELTVNLSFQDGSWWVIADNALLDAISGGILY